jgi:YggT family protein
MILAYNIIMWALSVYEFILFARVILSWIVAFKRDWTPKGPILVASEIVYTLTDPPLKVIRKFVKPVRLGGVALDMSVIVLFLIIFLSGYIVGMVFSAILR